MTPRTNTELFGHDEAEAQFMRDFASGKLAHGWIVSGQKGIGKATLAYRFARALLTSPSPVRGEGRGGGYKGNITREAPSLTLPPNGGGDNPVFQRIAANSHADLLVIEPIYDEKKEEHAREISVEQAREIAKFLSLTPGEGAWRVVIVDSADALNVNAANAILKILEEPPSQSVILLISHNPGRLLPTIRSRCHNLKLKPLDAEQFGAVMRHIAPEIEAAELVTLAQLSGHSPGIALDMHEQGATETYDQIIELFSAFPQLNTQKLHVFADQIMAGQQHRNWQMLTRLMLSLLESLAKQASSSNSGIAALHPASVWAAKWQQCADQFSLAEARHLDYKQVIITFFHSIMSSEVLVASG